jgi:hypothetical protein
MARYAGRHRSAVPSTSPDDVALTPDRVGPLRRAATPGEAPRRRPERDLRGPGPTGPSASDLQARAARRAQEVSASRRPAQEAVRERLAAHGEPSDRYATGRRPAEPQITEWQPARAEESRRRPAEWPAPARTGQPRPAQPRPPQYRAEQPRPAQPRPAQPRPARFLAEQSRPSQFGAEQPRPAQSREPRPHPAPPHRETTRGSGAPPIWPTERWSPEHRPTDDWRDHSVERPMDRRAEHTVRVDAPPVPRPPALRSATPSPAAAAYAHALADARHDVAHDRTPDWAHDRAHDRTQDWADAGDHDPTHDGAEEPTDGWTPAGGPSKPTTRRAAKRAAERASARSATRQGRTAATDSASMGHRAARADSRSTALSSRRAGETVETVAAAAAGADTGEQPQVLARRRDRHAPRKSHAGRTTVAATLALGLGASGYAYARSTNLLGADAAAAFVVGSGVVAQTDELARATTVDMTYRAAASVSRNERRTAIVATGLRSAKELEEKKKAEAERQARLAREAERRRELERERAAAIANARSDPKAAARVLMADHGWTSDAQYNCLVNLWTGESGWRYTAENASSGAYGIPQSLPGSKMAQFGSDWRTNPLTQIRWGLWYIEQTYGNPCNAWSTWLARSPHWY